MLYFHAVLFVSVTTYDVISCSTTARNLDHFKCWDSLNAPSKLIMTRGFIALILLLHWSQGK